jgi:hypothetical protein
MNFGIFLYLIVFVQINSTQPKKAGSVQKVLDQYFILSDALFSGKEAVVLKRAQILSKAIKTENLEHIYPDFGKTESGLKSLDSIKLKFSNLSFQLRATLPFSHQLEEEVFIVSCLADSSSKLQIWLSDSEKIRNPYRGFQMAECGKIIERIKPMNR